MRSTVRRASLALIVGATGCGIIQGSSKPVTHLDPKSAEKRYQWTASLVTPSNLAGAMQVRGTARWSPASGDSATSVAAVNIANATPGGVHPWYVRRGQCGENGAIVGDAAAYKPLKVGDDGAASGTARLNMPLPDSGAYYVNVHASAANLGTIISCGNLAPPVK
ncbi:MAG: hypothetical protein ACJ79S_08645 [Gemmatimonadaceae bacterium]